MDDGLRMKIMAGCDQEQVRMSDMIYVLGMKDGNFTEEKVILKCRWQLSQVKDLSGMYVTLDVPNQFDKPDMRVMRAAPVCRFNPVGQKVPLDARHSLDGFVVMAVRRMRGVWASASDRRWHEMGPDVPNPVLTAKDVHPFMVHDSVMYEGTADQMKRLMGTCNPRLIDDMMDAVMKLVKLEPTEGERLAAFFARSEHEGQPAVRREHKPVPDSNQGQWWRSFSGLVTNNEDVEKAASRARADMCTSVSIAHVQRAKEGSKPQLLDFFDLLPDA